MKYMLMFAGDESEEQRYSPEEVRRMYEELGRWWGEHAAAGRIVGGHELKPTHTATTVRRLSDGRITVTDGPFIESKEAFGGYAIVDVPDLDAAIELAKTWPVLRTLEVRPIVEARDESSRPKDVP